MRFFGIVLLAVLAAVSYGIAHDLVTVRVSMEYFTVGHPPVFDTTSPTLLALGWGVAATWWVGLPLGFLLAAVSQNGRQHPPLSTQVVARLIVRLLAVMTAAAFLSGVIGFVLASCGQMEVPAEVALAVRASQQNRFMAAWWAHGASYVVGIVGGLGLIVSAWRMRRA